MNNVVDLELNEQKLIREEMNLYLKVHRIIQDSSKKKLFIT
jgi:hypothetical protein